MNDRPTTILDIDLGRQDIQALSSADAIAAFFARLGYNTDARTPQTAGNLGVTSDSTSRPIKKIELLADQEGLLQVYLFELQSITVAHTRALARAFRNRVGNYLLVLTTDYDRLDFVFLERELPKVTGAEQSLGEKQSAIRPRVLTVDRRNPTAIHLRVLRRLTWTESDPFYQYEKFKAAYDLASWSEEHFNNRALFSDYYLKERLRDFPEWREDPKPSYLKLRELYQGAASRFAGKERKVLCQDLVEGVIQHLGFEARPGKPARSALGEPHYRLSSKEHKDSLLAVCQVYPWDRSLDGKDDRRDSETAEDNPGAVVVSLLEKGESSWVVVTNGRLWRLYAKRTHARATNYYEIDLEEVLSQSGPHAPEISESFRYFWLLFRSHAFELAEVDREGKKQPLSLLDQLLLYSEEYAKELGERLKDRVFEDIFPHLAAGFIDFIRQRDGVHSEITQETLNTVYEGTLTLLYRLLFLLYAESRDLLPVKEVRGYFEASFTKLKQEVADAAGTIEDEVEDKVKKHYREDENRLYDTLSRVFRVLDKGDPALNVPVYNGGLFLSDPEAKDGSPEADAARFLKETKVPDRFLARAIDLLARDEDRKRHDLVFIDFKSLGVRQLGSIYEGLLEFKLRIADRKLAITKQKGREFYVPFNDLEKKEQERAEHQEKIQKKGQVYLENDKHERKATGSYYTPDHIVKYIVEHAVGPVLKEKFDAMRPKLREAQQKHKAFFDKQEALRKQGLRTEPDSKAEFIGQEVVDELFNVKVLDPAMGSGHFLVEAVDYITDKTLEFLNAFPWNPIFAHLSSMRETILQEMDDKGVTIDSKRLTDVNLLKRHVLKRCIYGVDINPMAVELAKVSLWLDCFTLGAPLSFLDHHLRWGNSLIGVTVDQVNKSIQSGQLSLLSGTRFEGMKQAVAGMIRIGELSDVTSAQVSESRTEYLRASEAMKPAKRLLDIYVSQWFGNAPTTSGHGKKKMEHNPALEFLRDGVSESWAQKPDSGALPKEWNKVVTVATKASNEKRLFHWELEFPEVFYGSRPGTIQAIERLQDAGFDSVIGNPPYLSVDSFGAGSSESRYFKVAYPPYWQDKTDILALFLARTVELGRHAWGAIVKSAFIKGAKSEKLREQLSIHGFVKEIREFADKYVFSEADVTTAIVLGGKLLGGSLDLVAAFKTASPFDFSTIAQPLMGLAHIGQGMQTGANEVFVFKENLSPFTKYLRRRVRGEDVERFELSEPVEWVLWTEESDSDRDLPAPIRDYLITRAAVLKGRAAFKRKNCKWFQFTWPLHKEFYKYPKIWTPFRSPYNQFALDLDSTTVGLTDTTAIFVTSRTYSPKFLLGLLNSRLMEKIAKSQSKATGGGYHEYFPGNIEQLPIRRIDFNTPPKERKQHLQQLISQYRQALKTLPRTKVKNFEPYDFAELLHTGGGLANPLSLATDVLHDLLDCLVDQMMDLNQEKKAEAKRFFTWLEKELKIKPGKKRDSGIETLTGKTTFKNYLGDYQNDEDHTPFEILWEVVQKNFRRLGCSLGVAFQERMRQEHEQSLSVLLPIKQRLAVTDWLIDQLVYRLYGLSKEEIAIVEGRNDA
jgi:TaqI-like C-terminal specificity domain/Eco57I restriction-modification methylase